MLLDVGGQDSTEAFEDVGHSDEAREILDGLLVGTLKRSVRHSPRLPHTLRSYTYRRSYPHPVIADYHRPRQENSRNRSAAPNTYGIRARQSFRDEQHANKRTGGRPKAQELRDIQHQCLDLRRRLHRRRPLRYHPPWWSPCFRCLQVSARSV